MAEFRARDLWQAPALLCWSRLGLACCFPALVERPVAALAVLVAAGISDVLDGWVARRYGLVTATGAVLDPICDKLFVLSVALSLWASGRVTLVMIALLATRELAEVPLAWWYSSQRSARDATPMANLGGKLTTVAQFGALTWALFRGPHLEIWIGLVATSGVLSALGYWRRALSADESTRPEAPAAGTRSATSSLQRRPSCSGP